MQVLWQKSVYLRLLCYLTIYRKVYLQAKGIILPLCLYSISCLSLNFNSRSQLP